MSENDRRASLVGQEMQVGHPYRHLAVGQDAL